MGNVVGANSQLTRRQVIRSLVCGSPVLFPGVLAQLLCADARGAEDADPLAPRTPHFQPRAKRVIFLFMTGGVSHIDTFDPKPRLAADHGKLVTAAEVRRNIAFSGGGSVYVRPYWEFRPRGQCGTEVSDLFPHIGGCMDDICLIRSMTTDHNDHTQATQGIHTGSFSVARPSIGSWVSYGLGTFNQNLPSFVVLAPELPYAGTQVWSADFLPELPSG